MRYIWQLHQKLHAEYAVRAWKANVVRDPRKSGFLNFRPRSLPYLAYAILVFQPLVSKAIPSPFSTRLSRNRSAFLIPPASFSSASVGSVAQDWGFVHQPRLQVEAAPGGGSGMIAPGRDSSFPASPAESTAQTPSPAPCSHTRLNHSQRHSTSFSPQRKHKYQLLCLTICCRAYIMETTRIIIRNQPFLRSPPRFLLHFLFPCQ